MKIDILKLWFFSPTYVLFKLTLTALPSKQYGLINILWFLQLDELLVYVDGAACRQRVTLWGHSYKS